MRLRWPLAGNQQQLTRGWIAAAEAAESRGKFLAGVLEEKVKLERHKKRLGEADSLFGQELTIIKKSSRVFRTGTAREKYAWIEKMMTEHSIELMCRVLKASRSGFYEWRSRPTRVKVERSDLKNQIMEVFKASGKTYGHRSIRDGLISVLPMQPLRRRVNQNVADICLNATFHLPLRTKFGRAISLIFGLKRMGLLGCRPRLICKENNRMVGLGNA